MRTYQSSLMAWRRCPTSPRGCRRGCCSWRPCSRRWSRCTGPSRRGGVGAAAGAGGGRQRPRRPALGTGHPPPPRPHRLARLHHDVRPHVSRGAVNQWGSQLGLSVLGRLSQLYCSLVWESTVLLSLCTPNSLPPVCEFGQADMQKVVPKEEKAAPSPPPGREEGSLTFFICLVGFTSPVLFDERKFPYHLMLQKFLCSGGHNALFETFNWALSMGGKVPVMEGLEHPDLPDGTGGVFRRLIDVGGENGEPQHGAGVAPRAAGQSPRSRPAPLQRPAIPCHPEEGSPKEPQVNQQQLQQLMDMGFSQEHAMEACSTPAPWSKQPNTSSPALTPLMGRVVWDLSMSEEDQMMHAVAMSLGQDIPMDQRAESPEEAGCRKEEECRAHERQEEAAAKCLEKFEGAEPLEVAELLAFTDSMLLGCSQLLDELPDTVYRVCDLITTAIKCNGAAYCDSVLKQVVKQVWEAATSSSRRRCHSPPVTPKRCRNGSAKWRLCLKPPTWPCGSFSQPTPSWYSKKRLDQMNKEL
ncbi:E3 ubiquitin-protein ligase HUWE1-like [Strix uralensis]|uniref:E3 ubiquitin-protein ligase HUWE1-like n=1 Tax=Strix uralensis TaxID=36305 RepID=UPI003DA77788